MDFFRRHLLVQVLNEIFLDFRPADYPFVYRRFDGQPGNLAHLLKNFVSLRQEVLGPVLLGDGCGARKE